MSIARYLRMYARLDHLNTIPLSRHEREEQSADLVARMDRAWRMLTPRERMKARVARGLQIPGKIVP